MVFAWVSRRDPACCTANLIGALYGILGSGGDVWQCLLWCRPVESPAEGFHLVA